MAAHVGHTTMRIVNDVYDSFTDPTSWLESAGKTGERLERRIDEESDATVRQLLLETVARFRPE